MAILKIKNAKGEFENIPAIIGATGEQGIQGITGKDGHTPVLGVDYWTEEDKKAVENYCNSYIDSQLGTINEQLASLTEVE